MPDPCVCVWVCVSVCVCVGVCPRDVIKSATFVHRSHKMVVLVYGTRCETAISSASRAPYNNTAYALS